ncbi:MAG TPA: hypothetical protein VFS94_09495 [Gemmatimonadales bacterium]|nr:hypothetical protein [Gemmatimonadales bacterium]
MSSWASSRKRRPALVLAAILLAVGCQPPPPETSADQPPAEHPVAGSWRVEFTLDSVRSGTGPWTPADTVNVVGQLILAGPDTGQAVMLTGSSDFDFTPMLGRQISCYEPGPVEVRVGRIDERFNLHFTPGAADCGFGATVGWSGDSLTGRWGEASIAGPVAMGRVVMIHR